MLQIKEYQAKTDRQLACGHVLKANTAGYILTLFVCQQDAACLPQAIQACFAALQQQRQTDDKPTWLYRKWHEWFGKRSQTTPAP